MPPNKADLRASFGLPPITKLPIPLVKALVMKGLDPAVVSPRAFKPVPAIGPRKVPAAAGRTTFFNISLKPITYPNLFPNNLQQHVIDLLLRLSLLILHFQTKQVVLSVILLCLMLQLIRFYIN